MLLENQSKHDDCAVSCTQVGCSIGQSKMSSGRCMSGYAVSSRTVVKRTLMVLLACLLISINSQSARLAFSQASSAARSLSPLPNGVRVADTDGGSGWNRLVFMAQPRLASGATSKISKSVREAISDFALCVMARVQQDEGGNEARSRYELAEVGAGYAKKFNGVWTIVTPTGFADLGAKLSFVEKRVLNENQKQISTTRVIAKTSTLLLFDSPAIMQFADRHTRLVMRHLVWVNSLSGELACLVWLLREREYAAGVSSENDGIAYTVLSEPTPTWLDSSTIEDRAIHVDGDGFFFGVPTDKAFALESMPPGKAVPWTSQAYQHAGHQRYTADSLRALLQGFNTAFQQMPKTPR